MNRSALEQLRMEMSSGKASRTEEEVSHVLTLVGDVVKNDEVLPEAARAWLVDSVSAEDIRRTIRLLLDDARAIQLDARSAPDTATRQRALATSERIDACIFGIVRWSFRHQIDVAPMEGWSELLAALEKVEEALTSSPTPRQRFLERLLRELRAARGWDIGDDLPGTEVVLVYASDPDKLTDERWIDTPIDGLRVKMVEDPRVTATGIVEFGLAGADLTRLGEGQWTLFAGDVACLDFWLQLAGDDRAECTGLPDDVRIDNLVSALRDPLRIERAPKRA